MNPALFLLPLTMVACQPAPVGAPEPSPARERMVREQIEARGVRDAPTLAAMRKVPRHELVPANARARAYDDNPLPIGHDQTISQPYIVAFMTEALGLRGGEKVLEVGTGSGYQAAVLAEIAAEVYTIEIVTPLAERARQDLARLGYGNVHVRAGDGYQGWPEAAPFDAIIVTAAAPRIPEPLKEQLKDGGRLVIPVGEEYQSLVVLTRQGSRYVERTVLPVRFVPMTGKVRSSAAEPPAAASPAPATPVSPSLIPLTLPSGRVFRTEVMISDEDRAMGLMFRPSLPEDRALLFVFREIDFHGIWMKNCRFPIDIVWLDEKKKVVHVAPRVPPCAREPCPVYQPMRRSAYVVEMNAGAAQREKIVLGSSLDFTLPR